MNDEKIYNMDQPRQDLNTPERELWFAVIERALKDYCYFFEEWDRRCAANKSLKKMKMYGYSDTSLKYRTLREFDKLQWFIFSEKAEPFNLEYLTVILFEEPGVVTNIRKIAKQQLRLHISEVQRRNQHHDAIDYICATTDIKRIEPAEASLPLRETRNVRKSDI